MGFVYKNNQVAAKYCKILRKWCKIALFAANGIIWKLMYGLLPNLVHMGSLLFLIDSNGFCYQENIRFPQNAVKCCKNTAK